MSDILSSHHDIWEKKKILRVIYHKWYRSIISHFHKTAKRTVELGGGSGNFKGYYPEAISGDIMPCPWSDMVFDAHFMPFKNDSVGNIVMIDVLHHLANPVKFLNEAYRVLEIGGRVIILEPFPSPFSLFVYRRVHEEPFIFDVDYFQKENIEEKEPFDSNQAISYLLFYRHKKKFEVMFAGKYRIVKKSRMSCILYPVSGGFDHKAFIPDFLIPLFSFVELLFTPFRFLFAFRTFIVIKKI